MPPSLLMGKQAQAKPIQCRVLNTALLMRKEALFLGPSKISLDTSKAVRMKRYTNIYKGHLYGQGFLHTDLQLERQRFAKKR